MVGLVIALELLYDLTYQPPNANILCDLLRPQNLHAPVISLMTWHGVTECQGITIVHETLVTDICGKEPKLHFCFNKLKLY
jgi:hypothetical protein